MGVSDCDVLCKRNWKNIGRAYFLILTISHLSDVGLSLAGPISDENCMGNLRNSFKLTEVTTPSLPKVHKTPDRLFIRSGTQVCCVTLFLGRPDRELTETKVRITMKWSLVSQRATLQEYGRGLLQE